MVLSISVGMPGKFEDKDYRTILAKVAAAAGECGKAAGILLPNTQLLELVYDMGYRFVAAGSDGGMVMNCMQINRKAMSDLDRLKQAKDA